MCVRSAGTHPLARSFAQEAADRRELHRDRIRNTESGGVEGDGASDRAEAVPRETAVELHTTVQSHLNDRQTDSQDRSPHWTRSD